MTTAELVNHIHLRTRRNIPQVTDVEVRENTVLYTIGYRRYMADRELRVLETRDDKVFDSPHARRQEGILKSGKRDDDGNLIVPKPAE